MSSFQRTSALIVAILGVVCLVFGIVFVIQAGSAEQEIACSLDPLPISEVDGKYDAVKAQASQMSAAEEPDIQAGTAAPSAMYNYLSIQRTSLGLARSNIGSAQLVRMNGIINIIIGLGLFLTGTVLFRKSQAI